MCKTSWPDDDLFSKSGLGKLMGMTAGEDSGKDFMPRCKSGDFVNDGGAQQVDAICEAEQSENSIMDGASESCSQGMCPARPKCGADNDWGDGARYACD